MIYGNAVGGLGLERTYILADPDGNEVPAVMVDKEIVFTAKANDIRLGTVAATETGVTEGTKEIPAYHTAEGVVLIPSGAEYAFDLKRYDYTKLQALICAFNSNISDSVATEKVAIDSNVYPVNSTTALSSVTIDSESKKIRFGIMNDGETLSIMRYFTYKEEN